MAGRQNLNHQNGRTVTQKCIALYSVVVGWGLVTGMLVFLPAKVYGQTETGQITGKVGDPTGATIAGAKATVKSTRTGVERSAVSGSNGLFTITNLQPGVYSVVVQAQGFATSLQRQIQVTVGSKISLEITLLVTVVSDNVVEVVAGSGVVVNTQTQELSNVVSGKQLSELPTLTRNPYDLVRLSGNVARDTDDPALNVPSSTAPNGVGFRSTGNVRPAPISCLMARITTIPLPERWVSACRSIRCRNFASSRATSQRMVDGRHIHGPHRYAVHRL